MSLNQVMPAKFLAGNWEQSNAQKQTELLRDVVAELRQLNETQTTILEEIQNMAKSSKSAPPSMQSNGNKVSTPTNAMSKGGKGGVKSVGKGSKGC